MISGVDREKFQELMDDAKKAAQCKNLNGNFSPDQMRELALDYQKLARRQGGQYSG